MELDELEFHSRNLSSMQVFSRNLIFAKSSFSLKFDFLKIKFQNRDISLNSFRRGHFARKFRQKVYFAILAQKYQRIEKPILILQH